MEKSVEHWKKNDFPSLDTKEKHFALFRLSEQTLFEEISLPQFTLLSCFQKGTTLIDLALLLEKHPELADFFQTTAKRGWLDIQPKSRN